MKIGLNICLGILSILIPVKTGPIEMKWVPAERVVAPIEVHGSSGFGEANGESYLISISLSSEWSWDQKKRVYVYYYIARNKSERPIRLQWEVLADSEFATRAKKEFFDLPLNPGDQRGFSADSKSAPDMSSGGIHVLVGSPPDRKAGFWAPAYVPLR